MQFNYREHMMHPLELGLLLTINPIRDVQDEVYKIYEPKNRINVQKNPIRIITKIGYDIFHQIKETFGAVGKREGFK